TDGALHQGHRVPRLHGREIAGRHLCFAWPGCSRARLRRSESICRDHAFQWATHHQCGWRSGDWRELLPRPSSDPRWRKAYADGGVDPLSRSIREAGRQLAVRRAQADGRLDRYARIDAVIAVSQTVGAQTMKVGFGSTRPVRHAVGECLLFVRSKLCPESTSSGHSGGERCSWRKPLASDKVTDRGRSNEDLAASDCAWGHRGRGASGVGSELESLRYL